MTLHRIWANGILPKRVMTRDHLVKYREQMSQASVEEFLQPLALARRDIEELVYARLGERVQYEELSEIASPYLLVITPEKEGLSVEEARRITASVSMVQDALRLVVIHQFDQATDQAANALLKLFEDGVPGVLFLLQVSSAAGLLDTIKSRIVIVSTEASYTPPSQADMTLMRGLIDREKGAISTYVGRKWDRDGAGRAILAAKSILSERGVTGEVYDELALVYEQILSTNAILTYLMDRVFMALVSAGSRK